MHEWLRESADRLAREAGSRPADFELTEAEIDALLDLARIAAHESGERTNAPLLCYLVGLARARSGLPVEALADAAAGESA